MKLTSSVLDHEDWGNLEHKVRGLVTYRISQYEQRAFPQIIPHFKKCAARSAHVLLTVVPFFVATYYIREFVEARYQKNCLKNPDDYKEFYEVEEVGLKHKKHKGIPKKKKWPKL